jgi:murein DD-endopeptidase MepM/ murein hydrolase activator NlpD
MNGAPKYKDNLLFKYNKEIILIFCSLFVFFAIGNIFVPDKIQTKATPTANAYNVVYKGKSVGIVSEKESANNAFLLARANIKDENGEHVKIDNNLEYYLEYAKDDQITDEETLVTNIRTALIDDIDSFMIKAYVLKIGEDFQVALRNEDDVKEVLKRAQNKYINTNEGFEVDLVRIPYTISASKPVIVKSDNIEIASNEKAIKSSAKETTDSDSDEKKDAETPVETVGISFAEKVEVVKEFVDRDSITGITEATGLITKENEENKTYAVVKGDTLSGIAAKNDMKLSKLYELNPGVKEKRFINIGQELIITVPEPELSISTEEKVIYTKPIKRDVKKVENKNKYNGTNTVLDNGYDGEMEVTAIVTKVNGHEKSRSVVGEKVIKEPKDKVIEIGIKPFPSKGATGNFIYPVVGARVTSPFGYRRGGFHHGLDLGHLPIGAPIRASDGGRVVFAGWKSRTYGYCVDIDHGNGVLTRYAHCNKVLVKKGQNVSQYQQIAELGNTGRSTGPHVHFEIRFNGVAANPKKYLD